MSLNQVFNTTQSDLLHLNGMMCKKIRKLTENEADLFEVGDMYKIEFEDGLQIDAFDEEISVSQ